MTTTNVNNGNDNDKGKLLYWRRQMKAMVLTTTYENNGIDDDRRKQWY